MGLRGLTLNAGCPQIGHNIEINHAVELEDGTYKYQGTLEGKELEFLVEYAINSLLMSGAFPFVHEDTLRDSMSPIPEPGDFTEQ